MISTRFPNYKIPLNIHLTLQADLKHGKTSTSIFRQICKSVIKDVNIWANGNKSIIEKDHPIILACRGKFL